MPARTIRTAIACAFGIAAATPMIWMTRTVVDAQTKRETTWRARTAWGDPDLHGEWTSEGEYGVPFERPAQFGTRQFLNDEEYARVSTTSASATSKTSRRSTSSRAASKGRARPFRTGANTTLRRAARRS